MQWRCLNDEWRYCRKEPTPVYRGVYWVDPEWQRAGRSILDFGCTRKSGRCSETLCQHFASTSFPPPNPRHFRVYEDGSKCEVPLKTIKKARLEGKKSPSLWDRQVSTAAGSLSE